MSTRILLLATFGVEMVECGGALAKNAQSGGVSQTAVLLSRPQSRPEVKQAAEILGVDICFLEFDYGNVNPDLESKRKLIQLVREKKPDIIITQDPEHGFSDLDPDRRQAMILYLEAIALAGRHFALDECELEPHPIPTIYYMVPHHPNCIVDVAPVWDLKERAMDELKTQMEFSAQMLGRRVDEDLLRKLVSGDVAPSDKTRAELGRELHREMDKALHLYHGLRGHGSTCVLGEPYRREGAFNLQELMV